MDEEPSESGSDYAGSTSGSTYNGAGGDGLLVSLEWRKVDGLVEDSGGGGGRARAGTAGT